ncbi:MAG: hypothetical protein AB4372_10745 [Xenococcus sp. (in: cyanobacteria)]
MKITISEGMRHLEKYGGKAFIEGEEDSEGRFKVYKDFLAAFKDAEKRMSVVDAHCRVKQFPNPDIDFD